MVKPAGKEELQAMCSACFTGVPVERAHVQPGYNDVLLAYVTTYRCDGCRAADLAKTRARMAACTDAEELSTGELFFARYRVPLPDLGPDATLDAVRDGLLTLMDRLASGDLRIRIDPKSAIPIDLPKDFGSPGESPSGGGPFGGNRPGGKPSGGFPSSWLPQG